MPLLNCGNVYNACVFPLLFFVRAHCLFIGMVKSLIHHFPADHHHYGRWQPENVHVAAEAAPFFRSLLSNVVFLILALTMHINVFKKNRSEKDFLFCIPFNALYPLKTERISDGKDENVEKSRCCYGATIHINTFRDIQMGFQLLRVLFSPYVYLCKHLSGYICILFRVLRSPHSNEGERELFVPS